MYTQAYINMLAADSSQKERVTAYGKALGKLMNMVKAMAQRQEQAAQQNQGNGQDPEAMAAIQAKMAETQVKLQGKQMSDTQKRESKKMSDQQKFEHQQQAFEAEQQRKNMALLGDVQRQTLMATAESSKANAEVATEE